jgi:NurA-like 5'-3' nuclease
VPSAIDESFVQRFINALSETAVRGYPYQLIIAHKVANLSNDLMEMLCKAAGLTGFQEARGVLNV